MTERRQFVGHTSTAESDQFTGLSREITIDMQAETIRVHDGTTPGGFPLARADLANVSNSTIQNRVTNKEEVSNKVDVLDENVTHEQYPDARVAYNELLTKANRDLSNLTSAGIDFIKSLGIAETAEPSENTFVFKLGNGYVIQGGYIPANTTNNYAITLPVPMANSNYIALVTAMDTGYGSSGGGKYFAGVVCEHTNLTMTISRGLYENGHFWNPTVACGWLVIGKYQQ